jgi:hypothetical protein
MWVVADNVRRIMKSYMNSVSMTNVYFTCYENVNKYEKDTK